MVRLLYGVKDKNEETYFARRSNKICRPFYKKSKKKFELLNCGYGKSFKVIDIIRKIIKLSKKLFIEKDLTKRSLNTSLALNCTKAKKCIGWSKKTTIDQGIKKTLDWYLINEKKTI